MEMELTHILARNVISPKASWRLADVIIDEGPGLPAYALGTWDDERRVGFRWNGTEESPLGNPQSRGLPTWTMLDEKLHPAVLAMTPLDKVAIASAWLGLPMPVELNVDWEPTTRRRFLKEREGRKGMFRDIDNARLWGNPDAETFYREVATEIMRRRTQSQSVTYKDTEADI